MICQVLSAPKSELRSKTSSPKPNSLIEGCVLFNINESGENMAVTQVPADGQTGRPNEACPGAGARPALGRRDVPTRAAAWARRPVHRADAVPKGRTPHQVLECSGSQGQTADGGCWGWGRGGGGHLGDRASVPHDEGAAESGVVALLRVAACGEPASARLRPPCFMLCAFPTTKQTKGKARSTPGTRNSVPPLPFQRGPRGGTIHTATSPGRPLPREEK